MKGVGKKLNFEVKLHFLRYLTGGFNMIVGSFSCYPFVKILICRFTISISRFRITIHFTGNFPEISPKFFRIFSENSYFPTYPPYISPIPLTPTHLPPTRTPPELQTDFLNLTKVV